MGGVFEGDFSPAIWLEPPHPSSMAETLYNFASFFFFLAMLHSLWVFSSPTRD